MVQRDRQARVRIRAGMMTLKQFSIQELQNECGVSRTAVQRFIRDALSWGCLELVQMRENGKVGGDIYQLLRAPTLPCKPTEGQDARGQAWTTMRILRTFSLPDLERSAEISESNAKKYVQRLLKVGYLQLVQQRINGSRECNVYCLVRNFGPLAPVPRRDGTVFDPNINKLYAMTSDEH